MFAKQKHKYIRNTHREEKNQSQRALDKCTPHTTTFLMCRDNKKTTENCVQRKPKKPNELFQVNKMRNVSQNDANQTKLNPNDSVWNI